MARIIKLHDFQAQDASYLVRRFVDHRILAILYATGAGKTLESRAILSRLYHYRGVLEHDYGFCFTHNLIVTPYVNIIDNFTEEIEGFIDGDLRYPCLPVRCRETPKDIQRFLRGESLPQHKMCVATTHYAIVKLLPWLEEQVRLNPNFLHGKVLTVDEAHHNQAPKLSLVCELWEEYGGHIIPLTATPSHKDGAVIPTHAAVVSRTLPEQMEDGLYAPEFLECGILNVAGPALSDKELFGVPENYGQAVSAITYDLTQEAQKTGVWPRTLILIRPTNNSDDNRAIAAAQKESLEQHSPPGLQKVRVRISIGPSKEAISNFNDCLTHDKAIKNQQPCQCSECKGQPPRQLTFEDSNYDVLILICRGREGSDTVLASHLYLLGFYKSLLSTGQAAGRVMRLRREVLRYPVAWSNLSRVQIVTAGIQNLDKALSRRVLMIMFYLRSLGGPQWSLLNEFRMIDGLSSSGPSGKRIHPRLYVSLEKKSVIMACCGDTENWYAALNAENEAAHGTPLNQPLDMPLLAKMTWERILQGDCQDFLDSVDKISKEEFDVAIHDHIGSRNRAYRERLKEAMEEVLGSGADDPTLALHTALSKVAESFRNATLTHTSSLLGEIQEEILTLKAQDIVDYTDQLEAELAGCSQNKGSPANPPNMTRAAPLAPTNPMLAALQTLANHPSGR